MIQDAGGVIRTKYFPTAAKTCDYCKSAAALLFCRTDSAFLCIACDTGVHDADEKTAAINHGRVWICDVCEQAPAAVTCKADSASLCFTCDRDIHSANPLARRHERVPVVPFYETAESMVMKSAAAALVVPGSGSAGDDIFSEKMENSPAQSCYFPDSFISDDPIVAAKLDPDIKSFEFLFSDSDPILDFDNYKICSQPPYSDSVVPVQTTVKPPVPAELSHQQSPESRFEIDFTRSSITCYTGPSLSHSVSSSSTEVGVVPDGAAISETSYSFGKTCSQVVGTDREARVMRYKEKRKNRKFQKTIRYASRKAYAETRPRIKGRFAKRTESLEGIFVTGGRNSIDDATYGVVPWF